MSRKSRTFLTLSLFITLGLLAVHTTPANAFPNNPPARRRTESILNNPDAQPDLPSLSSAQQAAQAIGLSLKNIQGDILVGMKKRKELFFFFRITNPKVFKARLASDIHKRITTTTQLLSITLQPVTAVNIAFSASGLTTLGLTPADLGDTLFTNGQADRAVADLGDKLENWKPGYQGKDTHGVFLLASDTIANINKELATLKLLLNGAIVERHRLQGEARPGSQEGHEHFGFMDGISQPAVKGFITDSARLPGQASIDPGIILFSEDGDTGARPTWAKDGSFLAFRELQQFVPEFDKFLADNPLNVKGLTRQQNSELLGARMVGRWKSGAPIDLAPRFDDPVLARDPRRNNNFNFAEAPGIAAGNNQTRCPFSAHIRKTRPRADIFSAQAPEDLIHQIIRAGIPYGPEVTVAEKLAKASDRSKERGLAFVSYQTNLNNGFHFIQRTWANNRNFIFGKDDPTPGVDPIIGVDRTTGPGVPRPISGLDPNNSTVDITTPLDFVVARGGEYFFSPSLPALLDPIAK